MDTNEVELPVEAPVVTTGGEQYTVRIRGRVMDETGMWEGWIEFTDPNGRSVRTARETTQSNREDLVYWANGLTDAFFEGALVRALAPQTKQAAVEPIVVSQPKPRKRAEEGDLPLRSEPILDPYAVYAEGEQLLRSQLSALGKDHLLNIIRAYQFAESSSAGELEHAALVDLIFEAVRHRAR